MKSYIWNLLIAADQALNAVFWGDPDETISSRLGKKKLQQGGQLTWGDWYGIALPLDWILDWIDPGHSIDAIEWDEGIPVYDRRGNVVGIVVGTLEQRRTKAKATARGPTARDTGGPRNREKVTEIREASRRTRPGKGQNPSTDR